MRKATTSLTLSKVTRRFGKDLISLRGYSSLTALVEELLRREHERVFGIPKEPAPRDTVISSDFLPRPKAGK